MKPICRKLPALLAGWMVLAPAMPALAEPAPPERAARLEAAWHAAGAHADTAPPQADPAGSALRVIDEGFADIDRTDGIFAQGWIRQNNSDHPLNTWEQGFLTNRFLAHDGAPEAYIASHPFATLSSTGTISSWLLTPPIHFGPGTRISFYTRTTAASQWPTRLQVRACSGACVDVGTRPEDVGGFQALALDINPGEAMSAYPEEWTRYELGAADGLPTSGYGRVAFRHYVHQDDGQERGDWTGLDRVVVEQEDDADAPLDLQVTVAAADPAAPDACGNATTIEVASGDQVNFCYRVTNRTDRTLRYHSLRDSQVGTILDRKPVELAPGASWQYHRVLTVTESVSPTATWTGQIDPVAAYLVDDSQPLDWIEVSDGTPSADGTIPFPPGFDFRLFGDRIDTLCTSLGLVTNLRNYYNSCPSLDRWGVRPLPDIEITQYANTMALYETRFDGGDIYWKIVGTAPNRRLVVQYDSMLVPGGDGDPAHGLKAEVVLHEGSHVIDYQYANVAFGGQPNCAYGGCAGIGLQNRNLAQQYSMYRQSLRSVRRIVWTPADPTVYVRSRKVDVVARRAAAAIDAPSLELAAPVGGQASASVRIANLGDGRLDWRAGAAAANSHLPRNARFALPLHDAATAGFAAHPQAQDRIAASLPPPLLAAHAPTQARADDRPLWAMDVWGGYLIQGTTASEDFSGSWGGGFSIAGSTDGRTVTGADFLDDDFDVLYAIDADSHQLLRYDRVIGTPNSYRVPTAIGTLDLPTMETPSGLKQDPATGTLYLATSTGSYSRLLRVDTRNATAVEVAPIAGAPGILGIEFDNEGRLYGLDVTLDALFAIDKLTGEARVIGSLGFSTNGYISALAADPDDDSVLWLAAFGYLPYTGREDGSMWRIDRDTGQGTYQHPIVGPDGSWTQIGAMTFAHRGNRCTELGEIPWLHLDHSDGSIVPGAAPATLNLSLDAGALSDGVYKADLCIHSNDPLKRRTALPLTFTVGSGDDTIFRNGFDGVVP